METGRVVFRSGVLVEKNGQKKRFGIIQPSDSTSESVVFAADLLQGSLFDELRVNDEVSFERSTSKGMIPTASSIMVTKPTLTGLVTKIDKEDNDGKIKDIASGDIYLFRKSAVIPKKDFNKFEENKTKVIFQPGIVIGDFKFADQIRKI